jgi:hypothetical protein
VKQAVEVANAAELAAIDRVLDAGAMLVEAKGACKHGDWLPFLERAGVKERRARQYMQLARSGLKSATVADLGGVRASLEWLATLPPPPQSNHHLVVTLGAKASSHKHPFVVVTPGDGETLMLYRFNLAAPEPWWETPKRPIRQEALWLAVMHLLDGRATEMRFSYVEEAPLSIGAYIGEMMAGNRA